MLTRVEDGDVLASCVVVEGLDQLKNTIIALMDNLAVATPGMIVSSRIVCYGRAGKQVYL